MKIHCLPARLQEGGKHWERSRGEIEALVASGQPLPPDLQAVVDKRWVEGSWCRCLVHIACCHVDQQQLLLSVRVPALSAGSAQGLLRCECCGPVPACFRERGQRVNTLLKAGQPSEALELLADDPKLAWVKDAESGGGFAWLKPAAF